MNHEEVDREVATLAEWRDARTELAQREDAFLDSMEAMNAARRELPMVRLGKDYSFDSSDGPRSLLELFDKRSQLIVYHFWFEPGEEPCAGCSLWTSNLGDTSNLRSRDTSLVFVSRAPIDEIETAKRKRGWNMPWFSLRGTAFNDDTGYADVAQLSVFIHRDDAVLLTYLTRQGRDLETISSHWTLLDRTPSGR